MAKWFWICILFGITLSSMISCTSEDLSAANSVENYLRALSAQDQDALLVQVCSAWEEDALLELDAISLVQTKIIGLSCQVSGTDGNLTLVTCQGTMEATYGSEVQTLDLTARTFKVEKVSDDWLVCGYR